ncbi:hypothetical protein OSB04_011453 [Centaurea solstitialis]|uniref:Uncharacterized protein n=1 Tax=Centaurea solstitialis TaxID=347529 RepID=A0AA38TB64_9ASTR|nr:hypothetical protein OSB04_011453 [Centaurea solstitialis]
MGLRWHAHHMEWIIDSGATYHMNGTMRIFYLNADIRLTPVSIVFSRLLSTTINLCDSSIKETHLRLGHPSLSIQNSLDQIFAYLGRHTYCPYPNKVSSSVIVLFQCIQLDVRGPCPINSTNGFIYFIRFLTTFHSDEGYMINSFNEVFSVLCMFYAFIKTQIDVSINTLRSDKLEKYFSSAFTSYLSEHGMIHESLCAYTLL